jgi:hydroxyacylglutathione hydrolase
MLAFVGRRPHGRSLKEAHRGESMQPEIVTVPCLADNFAFLLHDPDTGATAVVDVPEAAPILGALAARGWRASDILLTHHHADHVQGVGEFIAALGAPRPRVVGAAADAHRLPPLDLAVAPGGRFEVGSIGLEVFDVSGHTVGHIAFHAPSARAAFTGDSLMAMGCGRLFEGSAAQMWESLSRLAALPDDTRILSGHDYTRGNAAFGASIEPGNAAIAKRLARTAAAGGGASVHVTLAEEKRTNVFLRAGIPEVRAALGMEGAEDGAVFAELRARKDRF